MSKLPNHLGGHIGVTNVDTQMLPYLAINMALKAWWILVVAGVE